MSMLCHQIPSRLWIKFLKYRRPEEPTSVYLCPILGFLDCSIPKQVSTKENITNQNLYIMKTLNILTDIFN